MEEKKFGLSKINYILIAAAFLVVVLGFIIMGGEIS